MCCVITQCGLSQISNYMWCADPSDNRFLECAVAGHADYLVTKNIRHFPQKTYEDVKIVRIRKFLSVLETIAESSKPQE